MTKQNELLKKRIGYKLKQINSVKTKFEKRMNEDLFEALRWSDDLFKNAAIEKWLIRLSNELENEKFSIDLCLEYLNIELINNAKYPQFSTSIPSNLLHQYEGSAIYEVIEILQEVKLSF